MVVVEVTMTNLLFFMLGFLACAAMIIVLAIMYVVFPKITEAKRFFDFWLKVKNKSEEKKE